MDQERFTQQLRSEGFDEVASNSMPAGKQVGAHSHAYEVKALVTQGEITLGVAGKLTTYRAGDVFSMGPGCEHTELCGADGVSYMVGRKHS